MQRTWLLAGGAGLVSSILFLIGQSGSLAGLFLAYISPLPLYMAALGLGGAAGFVAAAAGVVPVVLAGGFLAGIGYVAVTAAAATVLGHRAMLSRTNDQGAVEWYPTDGLASWLVAVGLAGYALLCIVLALQPAGLSGTVQEMLVDLTGRVPMEEKELFVKLFQPVMPGMAIAVWMLLQAVNGALAQRLLSAAKRAIRPAPRIADLQLPNWVATVGACAALGAILLDGEFGYFATNMVIVIAVPYFLQGLAVVHVLVHRSGGGGTILAVFYVMLLVLGWVAVLLVLLGLLEQVLGLRRRLDQSRE